MERKGSSKLEFVYGPSGGGKSTRLFSDMITRSLEHPERNYVVLVPEQATLLVQKRLLAMHPAHVLMNIDILSFQRMAYKVVEECHVLLPPVLNETGKIMILRKALASCKGDLEVFGKNLDRPGFLDELKSLVSELCQYEIPAESLEILAKQPKVTPLLKQKMRELSVICHAFKDQMASRYMMAEELLEVLRNHLYQSEWAADTEFYLDGFTGFTPLQYGVLDELMKYSRGLHLEMTVAPEQWKKKLKEHDLFYMTYEMKDKLERLAEKNQMVFDSVPGAGCSLRVKNEGALSWLEQHFGKAGCGSFSGESEEIRVISCKNPEQEVAFVAERIGELLRGGYRMKDIAVVTGAPERYSSIISRIFAREAYFFFLDEKRDMVGNACIEAIRAALEVLRQNYSYESMFQFLRCGISGLLADEINRMENYVLAMGIRGKSGWNSEWKHENREFSGEMLAKLNESRRFVSERFGALEMGIAGDSVSVKQQIASLRDFLESFHFAKHLEEMRKELEICGEKDLAKEYGQFSGKLEEFLCQFEGLMGEEVLGFEDFSAILDSGFGEMKVGLVPSTLDRIVVGDLKRTRLPEIKVLFVLGVNDGVIPGKNEKGGILSELDREILKDCQVELSPDGRQEMFTQRYYLYRLMTKPSGELVLSYSNTDADGKGIRRSELVGQILSMFPQMKVEHYREKEGAFSSVQEAAERLAEGFRRVMEGEEISWVAPLYRWLSGICPKEVEKMLQAACGQREGERLDDTMAFRVYGEKAVDSVTRLEQFASCPYAHFLHYGLGLRERREFELKPADFGNLYHKLLEVFQELLEEEKMDLLSLTEEQRLELAKKSLQLAAREFGSHIYESSFKNKYLLGLLEQSAGRNLWAIGRQIQAGGYRIWGTEVPFSVRQELAGGEVLRLRGRIDRVDAAKSGEDIFVRVIDYKTGQKEFDLSRYYYGLQLQLPIYLGSVLKKMKDTMPGTIRPGGFYYYRIQDPLVETGERESADRMILDQLRLSGVTNNHEASMRLLDEGAGKKSEIVRGLQWKQDGSVSAASETVPEKVLGRICDYAEEKAAELAEEIYSGVIEAKPYEYDKETSCDYCPYRSICGLDKKEDGERFRRLKKIEKDTIAAILKEEGKEQDPDEVDG